MGESTKAVSAVVLIFASVATAIAWQADRPSTMTWAVRIGGPTLAILALGLILGLHFRGDVEHDYLRDQFRNYFNCEGFTFAIVASEVRGIAYLDVYFQNQHERRCISRIAVRPARGFFLNRAKLDTMACEIDCAPAAFGFARLALPIPLELQGKKQGFDVGASVVFPDGKGRRLRFRDGILLRANCDFGNEFGAALTIARAATGSIYLSKPATTTVQLPIGVSENIPSYSEPQITTLWRLGDPPLQR